MSFNEENVVPPYKRLGVPLVVEKFFDQLRYNVVTQGKNIIMAFLGDAGTGKSWSAVHFGYLMDPWFDVNKKVVYEAEEFFDALDTVKHRGEVIVWDEAGALMGAREFQTLVNRIISKLLQIYREATPGRIFLIFATPRKMFLDKHARMLVAHEWRFYWKVGEPHPYCNPYKLTTIPHYRTKTMEDYVIYQLPRVRIGNLEFKIRRLYFDRLPDEIAKIYVNKSMPKKHFLRFSYMMYKIVETDKLPKDVMELLFEVSQPPASQDIIVWMEEAKKRFGMQNINDDKLVLDMFFEAVKHVGKTYTKFNEWEIKNMVDEFRGYLKAMNLEKRFIRYFIRYLYSHA